MGINDNLLHKWSATLQSPQSGSVAEDLVGTLDGTMTNVNWVADTAFGGSQSWQSPLADGLISFAGLNQYTDQTIAYWFQRVSSGGTICSMESSSNRFRAATGISTTGPSINIGDSSSTVTGAAASWLNIGDWGHFTMVIEGATNTVRTYCNGVANLTSVGGRSWVPQTNLTLARMLQRFDGTSLVSHRLDTIRYYNRALSTAEALELYTAGRNESGLSGVAPNNTTPPAVTGTPTQGQMLTSTQGTWTGTPTPTIALKWQRGNLSNGSDMADIGGATGATYVLQAADVGKYIRSFATATNSAGSDTEPSNIVGPIIALAAFKPWYRPSTHVVQSFGR